MTANAVVQRTALRFLEAVAHEDWATAVRQCVFDFEPKTKIVEFAHIWPEWVERARACRVGAWEDVRVVALDHEEVLLAELDEADISRTARAGVPIEVLPFRLRLVDGHWLIYEIGDAAG